MFYINELSITSPLCSRSQCAPPPVLWNEILDTMWSAELFVFNVGTKNQTGLFDTLSAFGTNTQNREGAKLNLA